MTIQPCPPSFLALCRKRTGTSEKRREVSSFLPIAGKLETVAPSQATQAETAPPAKQPESLTGREVSKETKQETSWKPAPETMETFATKNTPKSFQVSNPPKPSENSVLNIHFVNEDAREAFEERSAIMEFEGGLGRQDAEWLAMNVCQVTDENILEQVTKDDRVYVLYHLTTFPARLRGQLLKHYLVVYQKAYDECLNPIGRENAGRKAANIWLRTDAKTWGKP